jgi:spore germination cell wall hydrolase CwlJ-like protein
MRLIPDDTWGILTIWMEARGESYDGKVAVAEVIQKRTARKFFSDGTVAGTCLKDRQFSGWNNGDPNRIKAATLDDTDPVVNECINAWKEAKTGRNLTGTAVHYYNSSVCFPIWAEGARVVTRIGAHTFVIPKEG